MNVDYEKVERIVKEVLCNKRGFSFDLHKSQKSESLYLSLHYENVTNTIRISDHKNGSKCKFSTEIVSHKINVKCLYRAIENVCERMHRQRVYKCLEFISMQREQLACQAR